MQKRRLGQSGLEVSAIGLGTVKFGRNTGVKYPQPFTLPTDQEILTLLAVAREQGINFLDTAPAYGNSEERLGALLGKDRAHWVIATKAGEEFVEGQSQFNFSPAAIIDSVHRSLKRLRTDYVDIVLIHSDGNDERLMTEENVFATLAELKQAGKIRAYGMSTKTIAGGLLALSAADVVMLAYNLAYTAEREVIAAASLQQKGILIKKAFASGHLGQLGDNPILNSLRFIFENEGVTSVVLGTLNPEHLKQNAAAVREVLL